MRGTLAIAVSMTISGCFLARERGVELDGSRNDAALSSDDASADAATPIAAPDATYDASPARAEGGCGLVSFDDASVYHATTDWDAGPRTDRPLRGGAIASDGASFGLAWSDWGDGMIHFARVSPGGDVLARTVVARGSSGRLLPSIAWSGERYAVMFESAPQELAWVELDASGGVLSPARVAGEDVCGFAPTMMWSGDRWTRVSTTESAPTRAVVTQVVPGRGVVTFQIPEIRPNTCDNIGAAWDGEGFAVVWSDWTAPGARLRFARLAADGSLVADSIRSLFESDVRSVQGFSIAWTGTDFVAVDYARGQLLHVSRAGEVLSELPSITTNASIETPLFDGCAYWAAEVVQPSFAWGYVYATGDAVHEVLLEYGTVGEIGLARDAAGETGYMFTRLNGVFFVPLTPLGPTREPVRVD